MNYEVLNDENKNKFHLKLKMIDEVDRTLVQLQEYIELKSDYDVKDIIRRISDIRMFIKNYYPEDEYNADVMLNKLLFLINDLYSYENGLANYIKWSKNNNREDKVLKEIDDRLYIDMMQIIG
jgi:hypothetical protein